VVILIVDHEFFFLVTANDFGSSKTNPGQRPKHHFCCGDMGKKKLNIINAEIWENNAEI
jgi:hypothetical protein